MLYLLGGAPRVGKTTIATNFCAQQRIGWLSMDVIRTLARSLSPELASLDRSIGRDPYIEAEALYASFEVVAAGCYQLTEDYLIEGVWFMPCHVERLPKAIERRACFVGLSMANPDTIDAHAGRNTWHRDLSDPDQIHLARWITEWSQLIESDCHRYGIPYIDLASDWTLGAELVQEVLRGPRRPD